MKVKPMRGRSATTSDSKNGEEGGESGDALKTAGAKSESAAEVVARHLSWRLGDSKGEGSQSAPTPNTVEDDNALYIEQQGDTLVVVGDIDLHQAGEFRERAEAYIQDAPQPRLDLSRVPFLDSAGLATLLALSRLARSQNKSLRLIVTGSPRRVLKITGIDRVLVLED